MWCVPGLVPSVHEVSDVMVGRDGELGQVLDVRPHDGMLSHPQRSFTLGVEQIPHALAVDLHIGHLNTHTHTHTHISLIYNCASQPFQLDGPLM